MGYTLACLENLSKKRKTNVEVVYWDKNKLTPYYPESPYLNFYPRSSLDYNKLIGLTQRLSPDMVYISGRMDNTYLRVARYCRSQGITTISGMDNQYLGNVRQKIAALFSPLLYRKYFDYIWVPGESQKRYALKLGSSEDRILTNLYSADYELFSKVNWKFSKRLVYTGRFAEVKNIERLINAFQKLELHDWKLTLIGSGPLENKIKSAKSKNVEVISFLNPGALMENMGEGGVFCLPSLNEPYGVVVHEYAAAGYPLLVSNRVGAIEHFLQVGKNGYIFEPTNEEDLKEKLLTITSLSESKLTEMSKLSKTLASTITPTNGLMNFCQ